MTLRQSPLVDQHRALDAQLVEFGGWEMPISYPSGTVAEHLACRNSVAMFDVSHLGTVRVSGPDAFDTLQATLTNDLTKVEPGRAQYTHLLDEETASVVDDIIVWWHADDPECFDVMPNASNTDGVVGAIGGTDITATRAVIAVQGPQAVDTTASVIGELARVGRFRVGTGEWSGLPVTVAGTGYTGEPGIEISAPTEVAPSLWEALADAGATPAGLGARDTLRLEAGLPLHGHELGEGITPLQAGLGWVIGWKKPTFRGRIALEAERETGVTRRLTGLTVDGRRPPRAGCDVLVGDDVIGEVTSGNFSPVLGHGIAMAFLPPDLDEGTSVEIDVRGKRLAATVAKMPFI